MKILRSTRPFVVPSKTSSLRIGSASLFFENDFLVRRSNRVRVVAYGLDARCRFFSEKSGPGSSADSRKKKGNEVHFNPDLPDYNTSVNTADIKLESTRDRWRRKDLFGQSLVGATMNEVNDDGKKVSEVEVLTLKQASRLSLAERKKRRRILSNLGIPDFQDFVRQNKPSCSATPDGNILKRRATNVLQMNIGLYCNQACSHCHVESSPLREEGMTLETVDNCLKILKNSLETIHTLDITGGAPELNNHFRYLVEEARKISPSLEIIDRCNLTAVHEPGQEDLVSFLAKHKVHVIASMPCYSSKNVNMQRGQNVFDRSISALLAFNDAGYGKLDNSNNSNNNSEEEERLTLDLVYNPLGAFLPPPQAALEEKYKHELLENFGIEFNQLYTMNNMPIKRFADFLSRRKELKEYMELLTRNFNYNASENLMCANTLSINWDGRIFDCDFNQQLDLGGSRTVNDLLNAQEMSDLPIEFDTHCFGCTAGAGSS